MSPSPHPSAPPRVVVVGGGYGGITVAKALDAEAEVVLVEPRDTFVHHIGALRALVDPSFAPSIFMPLDRLLANGRVVHERAARVDAGRVVLDSGRELEADYVVLATGSRYPYPAKPETEVAEHALARLREGNEALAAAGHALIVGAGPVGLELAGEIRTAFPGVRITVADVSDEILDGPYDPALRAELRAQLEGLGVELLLGSPLVEMPATAPGRQGAFTVRTEAGASVSADVWFRCFGVTPVSDYLGEDLAVARTPEGFISVTPELRVAGQERVFAVGDVSTADRKMAAFARMQAEIVAGNIRALQSGEGELATWERFAPAIAVPLGPEGGAGQFPGQEGIVGAEAVAEVKGREMMVGGLAEALGLEPAPTSS
jgi:NADH dehydrogenase FAD-containing subunit